MNILFLMLSFPNPEHGSNMYTDLVEVFAANGHNVYPIAPSYDGETQIVAERNFEVLRVKTGRLFNVDPIRKGISNVILPYQYEAAISKYYKGVKFDLIIAPTPPVTLASLAKKIKNKHNAKMYLMLRDIFPQNAVDMGMMTKFSLLYWGFRRQEKLLYEISDKIGCMSPANIDYVKSHNKQVDHSKLHILMNFQKPETVMTAAADIRLKYGLNEKFVIVFGGNMGVPQKLENVIAFAKALQIYPDVLFLLVGKGTQRARIEALANAADVSNIVFKDFIPRDDYQQLVSLCDIGLISLNENFTIPNIPSKTLSYFNLGVPVLASVDKATDYGEILKEADAGYAVVAGDVEGFVSSFTKLYNNRELLKQKGKNGRDYFLKKMTPEVAYKTIMKNV